MILSPPRQTFRQTYAIRMAVAILLLAPAVIAYFVGAESHSQIAYAVAAALVILTVLCWILLGKTVLTIHDEGVRRTTAFGTKELEWHQVREYRYRVVPVQVGGLVGIVAVAVARRAGGRAATTNLYLVLIGDNGVKIAVTSSFKNAYDAVGMILGAVHERMRPAIESQVGSTGVTFGPLRLSARELQWKQKEPVPLGELMAADITGQNLRIRRKGKMLSLVSVRSDKVPNVLLLLETMERLGVGASAVPTIDPLARVRI